MGIQEGNVKGFPVGWRMAAKPCDSCKSSAALLFCRVDSAFLCMSCDSKIHGANKLAMRHERVWMCEVCEQAPAAVTCKADAAALCVSCDSDIHSANPLSRRHDRVPVVPFYVSAELLLKSNSATITDVNFLVPEEEAEAASWILQNPKLIDSNDLKNGDMFFSDLDHLLDFDYPKQIDLNFNHQRHGNVSDSVVPVQNKPPAIKNVMNSQENCFDIDFCKPKISAYNYANTHTLSHSVSSSSLDVGVVPEGSVLSDISYPFGQQAESGGNSSASQATQLSGMDREARVMRYREKRKNRKFEKTIRYASRKAYAETRPRIKGRFAKRTDAETELDCLYGSGSISFMPDAGYGVVPSF